MEFAPALLTLPDQAFVFAAVFARVGAAVMLMPAIGDAGVSPRIRLAFALAMTAALMPAVAGLYPPMPAGFGGLAILVGGEALTGILLGAVTRIVMSAMQLAGSLIAMQTGLGFAMAFDPAQGSQSAVLATFLSLLAVTLIFVTGLHHLFIEAVANSFVMFPPAGTLPVADFSALALDFLSASFALGVQLAAPLLVFGLVFYAGIGLISKLMPQLQIFFIAMPANIILGFGLLMLTLGAIMGWFLDHVAATIGRFAG